VSGVGPFLQLLRSCLFFCRNPGAFAVEDEMERVLHEVGAISDRDFGDLHKVSEKGEGKCRSAQRSATAFLASLCLVFRFSPQIAWNRAARTDKGVHAAGQVVSFRMHLPPGSEAELIEKINARCPPDLRCIDINRVINNFNAKNLCNSRQYEYLLPTFTLEQKLSRIVMTHLATHRRAGKPMSQAAKKAAAEAAAAAGAAGAVGAAAVDAAGAGAATNADGEAGSTSAAASSLSFGLLDPLSTNPFAGGLSSGGHLTAEERMKRAEEAGKDRFANGEAYHKGRLELASMHSSYKHSIASSSTSNNSMEVDGSEQPKSDFPSYFYRYSCDEGIAKGSCSSDATTSNPDKWQTGEGIAQGNKELRDSEEKRLRDIRTKGYRLSASEWQRLSDLAAQYIGTKAYHNFTPRMTFGDASTVRFVMDCRVSKPFVIYGDGSNAAAAVPGSKFSAAASAASSSSGSSSAADSNEASQQQQQEGEEDKGEGVEYVKFTIVGQSFLYNQIRHMVGLVADIMRGAAPSYMMDRAFSVGVVRLPLAPAEGLYLSHCNFGGYDKKYTGPRNKHHGGSLGALRPMQGMSKRSHELFNGFKEGVIWAHIHKIIVQDRPFHKYIEELLQSPLSYRTHVPIQLIEILTRQNSVTVGGAQRRSGPTWARANSSATAAKEIGASTGAVAIAAAATALAQKQKLEQERQQAAEAAVGDKRKREEDAPDAGDDDEDDAPAAVPAPADDDAGSDGGEGNNDNDDDGGEDAAPPAKRSRPDEESSSSSSSSASSGAGAQPASGAAASALPKTFRQRIKENDAIVFSYILDHIDTLLLKPANTSLLSGVSVSKVAKEKADFKRKLKGELNEIRKERAEKREANANGGDGGAGGADGEDGAAGNEDDGTGDQYIGSALRERLQQRVENGDISATAPSKPAGQGWRSAGGRGGGQPQTWRNAGGRGGGGGGWRGRGR
jgi:tRNA pseudouridine(38-40) synthase